MDEATQFQAAIAHAPDDDDAYLVYGDWLQQRGDPRGELIMLQHRGHEDAAKDLLSRNAKHFYGALAARPGLLDATWHLGFMRSCRFSLDDDRGTNHEQRAVAALEELLALESARFLRQLSIGVMNVPFNSYRNTIEVIGRHDLGFLERLSLGDGIEHSTATRSDPFATAVGRTVPIYSAAPNLRSLVLRSTEDDPDVDGMTASRLSELRISGGGNGVRLLQSLWQAVLPELHTLELVGSFVVDESTWKPLFNGRNFPKLRDLVFGVHSFLAGRVGSLVAKSSLLPQLRTLDLSSTGIDYSDVDAMLANADAFSHLEHLDLGLVWDVLSQEDAAALEALCATVTYRYLSPG